MANVDLFPSFRFELPFQRRSCHALYHASSLFSGVCTAAGPCCMYIVVHIYRTMVRTTQSFRLRLIHMMLPILALGIFNRQVSIKPIYSNGVFHGHGKY